MSSTATACRTVLNVVRQVSNQRSNSHQTKKATSKVTATGVAFLIDLRTARLIWIRCAKTKPRGLWTEYT
jgi:hypothetical protein